MNKFLKISIISLASLVLIVFSVFIYFVVSTNEISILDAKKLKKSENFIEIYDKNDELINLPQNNYVVYENLPPKLLQAFVSIEDKRFFEHKGLDYRRIVGAIANNIRTKSFEQGASTISQQLIKNTHLSSEKTFKRKFAEARLVKKLEKAYSKEEILEMYLNSIYFGENCYGIGNASRYYFDKNTTDLDLNECAILASIIKSPNYYSNIENKTALDQRKNLVLSKMLENNYINSQEYEEELEKNYQLLHQNSENYSVYVNATINEACKILKCDKQELLSSKAKIYTYLDKNLQKKANEITMQPALRSTMHSTTQYENMPKNAQNDACIVLCNTENSGISVFSSNIFNAFDLKRQPASTIKPFLVYAPAFDNKIVETLTILEDKVTDFDGYSPSNYKDLYYGDVSVRESLYKSLNVPSVKIFNSLQRDNVKKYAKSIGIDINNYNLGISLGTIDDGLTFSQIVSAYSMLADGGMYKNANFVRKIDKNNMQIYQNSKQKTQVLSQKSAFVTADILKDCAKIGTAKALDGMYGICSKTGTQGTENGNTDAYNVSFSKNFVLLNWIGGTNSQLLPNTISGGTLPTQNAKDFLNFLAKSEKIEEITPPTNFQKQAVDKAELQQNNKILLADKDFSTNEVVYDYLLKDYPASNRYSLPKTPKVLVNFEKNKYKLNIFTENKLYYEIFLIRDEERVLIKKLKGNGKEIKFSYKINGNFDKTCIEVSPIYYSNGVENRGKSFISNCYLTGYNFDIDDSSQNIDDSTQNIDKAIEYDVFDNKKSHPQNWWELFGF